MSTLFLSVKYLCCLLYTTYLVGPNIHDSAHLPSTNGIRAILLFNGNEIQNNDREEEISDWKKRQGKKLWLPKEHGLYIQYGSRNPKFWWQKLFPMERDDEGCSYHPTPNRGNTTYQQDNHDGSSRIALTIWNRQVDHSNVSGRKRVLQHGQGNNNICLVGKATGLLRKTILLIKTHIDPTTVQYEDERDRTGNLPH